ncbi:MAG: hypothetical protein QXK71_02535 [Pyrobaculum sp.]
MDTIYRILSDLGEADLETIIKVAAARGVPPVVASRLLQRLIELGRVEAICGPSIRYRAR